VLRRERFDVDSQQVRSYFDFAKVRRGLLEVTGRLFDVEYVEVAAAVSWHEDVATYDVVRRGERLGRIHLDLHPRTGKYGHAAQFELAAGIAGQQLAEGVLVCNFSKHLMEHSHVVTLFHEFGHLLHHVLAGGHRWTRFSGVATEWDFVEAPSQMLEEWAWDADVLQAFATDADGRPIPGELVAKMRAANEFGKGTYAATQMFYAALSYRLHQDVPEDISATTRELQATYDVFGQVPDTHFYASFGHLQGYGSGYYTYMWSLVIAKDLFSAFDRADMFAAEVAHRYRDRVLVPGGSRDAADLVSDFLGRAYDFAAFERWLDTV
jgi:thimet oligopeptidase